MAWKQYQVVEIAPTLDTNAFASGDQISTIQTIDGPSEGYGAGACLEKIVIVDKAKQSSALKLVFFDALPTVASSENAAADVSDAQMAAKCIGAVSIAAGDYVALNANSVATVNPAMAVRPSAGTNKLYVLIVSAGSPTYGASDLQIKFTFSWE